ncbi:hypothetical protein M0805_007227 [Coniferiporia weirii]|nr:hypothetical protein M0805_007227 [Coniferiporia weirii]
MVAPRVFLDFAVDGVPLGRVIFELFNVSAPKTSENFRALCTGEKGVSPISQQPLFYKNSTIHRSIRDFMIQGGDFTKRNGTGGESIYGAPFADEDLSRPVDEPGLLVMANKGPNTNNSQFFITLRPCPHLAGKHVVFGRVLRGFDNVVCKIGGLPTDARDRPTVPVVIANCGELELRRPPPKQPQRRASTPVSESDEDSDRDRGRKRSKRRSPSRSPSRSRSRTPASAASDASEKDSHRRPKKLTKSERKEKKEKKEKKKSKKRKERSRSASAARPRSPNGDKDRAAKQPREETEEEYDARLEREELERIEAARKRDLEEMKRRYAEEEARRRTKEVEEGDVVRYKGRGRMRYIDPELALRSRR